MRCLSSIQGSKYGERLPIGLMSIVDSFKPLTLRHYYEKWYRPDNQAIIVVGDIDVDHTEAMIKQLFGGIKVPANAAKVVAEPVPDNAKPIYIFEKDKEQQYSTLGIEMKSEAVPDSEKTNIGYMVDSYVKNIITSMLSSRFNEMSQKEDCPFTQMWRKLRATIFLQRPRMRCLLTQQLRKAKIWKHSLQ
jgi:zinc protease